MGKQISLVVPTTFLLTLLIASPAAFGWGTVDIKTGKGEEVQVKKGFFGNEKFVMQDRMGDHVVKSRGILGNKHDEVSVMGNGASYNRNIFGVKSVAGGDMLGDKFESHRMLFGLGPRITKVDVSGATGVAEHLFSGGLSGMGPGMSSLGAPGGGLGGAFGGGPGGGQVNDKDLQRFSPLRGYRGKPPEGTAAGADQSIDPLTGGQSSVGNGNSYNPGQAPNVPFTPEAQPAP
jgi:hypothetical protein